MKVDIYIHGVPNGQRIWGTSGDDQVINQFYGAGGEEHTKFLAEVRKSGGQNYCYYSILKYKNVAAEGGRAGSYFGLTIRMDMVCTKIKAMFQILDMIYSNAVIGKFLKKDGERLQYIVSDFRDKENLCKTIVDKIMTMLGQSVEGNDFVGIIPSMLSNKGIHKFNIAEYGSENALSALSQNGSVAISAEYPSMQLSSYIKKKDDEVSTFRQQSQQEINRIQQQAALDLQEQERKSNDLIRQTRNQANLEIEKTKAKYNDVDRKLLSYDQQLKQMQRENRDLQNNVAQLQRIIQERDRIIAKHRDSVSVGSNVQGYPHKEIGVMDVITSRVLPFVNLLIGIVIIVVFYLLTPSDNSKAVDQISNDLTELKEKMDSVVAKQNRIVNTQDLPSHSNEENR